MKIWRIFLALTSKTYTWYVVKHSIFFVILVIMDHHSLNWAKKNSTSRIHPTKLTGKLQGGDNEKVLDIQDCPWIVSIGHFHLKNPPNKVDRKVAGWWQWKGIGYCPWTVSIRQLHLKNPPNEVDSGGELVALSPSLPLLLTYTWNLWLCLVYSSLLCWYGCNLFVCNDKIRIWWNHQCRWIAILQLISYKKGNP